VKIDFFLSEIINQYIINWPTDDDDDDDDDDDLSEDEHVLTKDNQQGDSDGESDPEPIKVQTSKFHVLMEDD